MSKAKLIFEKQFTHYLWLLILLFGLFSLARLPGFWAGDVLGISTRTWFYFALGSTLAHQFYVWFCWRTQLHMGLLTRHLGSAAFSLYAAGFAFLIILRPVLISILAVSNRDTVPANPEVMVAASIIMTAAVIYLLYSIIRYFSFRRALGIDHFDESFRVMPLVREGIFRFTSNGMYVVGFLILWIPALLFSSVAASGFALFSHLYIWVHYFTVEKPDMIRIYGSNM